MEIDLSTARTFSLELVDHSQDSADTVWFPRDPGDGADGPVVTVTPENGDSWTAGFADAGFGPTVVPDTIFAMPDGESFCVLAGGQGYIVSASDADDWVEIGAAPVIGYVVSDGMAVFHDHWRMVAYTGRAWLWDSGRLVLDDLHIEAVDSGIIHARGSESGVDVNELSVTVDLATGQSNGARGSTLRGGWRTYARQYLKGIQEERMPGGHFCVLLAVDGSRSALHGLRDGLRYLLESGMVYLCTWGPGCEDIHDLADELIASTTPQGRSAPLIRTTWHADETLEEAAWFAQYAAFPDEAFEADFVGVVAFALGDSRNRNAMADRLSKALCTYAD